MDRASGHPTPEYLEIDHPWISNDLMPLYRWTFPSEATDEELHACFQARNEWARRVRYPVAWVTDLTNITKAPATQRKALAEHLKQFEAFSERWNAGSALIVPSAWLRGLVTAVFWVSPPKYPHKTFSELLLGERWAQEQLARKLAERD
ncbi:MAG: hypothetical protein OEV36_13200 [Myxococcales bacterium]|nr:hypothetical protein [Myxococcales bacterium]